MDTCPGLIGGLNDPSTSCNIPDPVNEVVTGTMSALPGNNPVGTWGGGKKPTPTSSTATTSAVARDKRREAIPIPVKATKPFPNQDSSTRCG